MTFFCIRFFHNETLYTGIIFPDMESIYKGKPVRYEVLLASGLFEGVLTCYSSFQFPDAPDLAEPLGNFIQLWWDSAA